MSKKPFTPTDLDRQKPDDGGPASAMSLRDRFVIAALAGLIANVPWSPHQLAADCYQMADALIAARKA